MNKDLAKDAIFATMARGAVDLAGKVAIAVGAYKLMTAAISGAREQMQQMVEIADKAQNLGVSPAFLQAFTSEARKLKVEAGELESALDHAFQATKDRSPIDIGEWTVGEEKITAVEKALRVYNETLAKDAGRLQGLVLFRDAQSQEDKIKAVLAAMIQLDQIGQHAASLDLGEKMFGSQIVDRMRQGKTSAESMLQTIREASANSDGIFSNVQVERAKEVDDQLKLAHQRLSTALKPSWDDLASVMMNIKSAWADVIGYIAKAVELTNKLPRIPGMPASSTDLEAKRDALAQVNARLNGTGGGLLGSVNLPPLSIPGIGQVYAGTTADLEAHRDRLQKEIAALRANGEQYGPPAPSQTRGTGPAPTKISTGSNVDKLDTAADSIEKRTAALREEAAGLDLSTAAREKNKIAAQLQVVAMQANAAAGKGEGVVTEEQRKRIEEVTQAYGEATQAIEQATVAQSIRRGRQTSLLDPGDVQIAEQLKGLYPDVGTALNSVEASALRTNEAMRSVGSTMSSSLTSGLADVLDGTKSVSAGFADMSKAIVRALEEAVIKALVVAPIMRGLSGMFGFSDGGLVGSLPKPGDGAFIGPVAKADGGYISGPGTGTSDSIPARLSNGEFVVRASAVAKHRAVLEAINSDRISRFADGGLVGAGSPAAPLVAGQPGARVTMGDIHVHGGVSNGTPAQNQELAQHIAEQVTHQVRAIVGQEFRTQMRPGGVLRR
ncbi:hypothetical protein [Bradyrhizobium sp. CB2312]|uniref:hypothetical protein n=1 Tax=Bradyrhizobium sp. CB2312 TaxID=3039155 RepID=UPI0024B14851|nr:hypothetical protein [Bradyrhizobium sp. CB2312]WFU76579.1 hypothetical protein QA642_22515 [Bradyrhizobium sp. CB2312]